MFSGSWLELFAEFLDFFGWTFLTMLPFSMQDFEVWNNALKMLKVAHLKYSEIDKTRGESCKFFCSVNWAVDLPDSNEFFFCKYFQWSIIERCFSVKTGFLLVALRGFAGIFCLNSTNFYFLVDFFGKFRGYVTMASFHNSFWFEPGETYKNHSIKINWKK